MPLWLLAYRGLEGAWNLFIWGLLKSLSKTTRGQHSMSQWCCCRSWTSGWSEEAIETLKTLGQVWAMYEEDQTLVIYDDISE